MCAVTPYLRLECVAVVIVIVSVPLRLLVGFGGVVGQVFRFSRLVGAIPALFTLLGVTTANLAGSTDAQGTDAATGTTDRLTAEDHADRHAGYQQYHNKQNQKKGTHYCSPLLDNVRRECRRLMGFKTVVSPYDKVCGNVFPGRQARSPLITHHVECSRQCVGCHAIIRQYGYRCQFVAYRFTGIRVNCMGMALPL